MRGASGAGGQYQIARSLRFNKPDNANLSRTVGGSGNRRTFTFSAWIKRASLNTSNVDTPAILMATDQATGSAYMTFGSYGVNPPDTLQFNEQSGGSVTITNAVFRDLSAWYHIILAVDTTQATSTNRVKIYVNGIDQTFTSGSTYPPLNTQTYINYSSFPHKLGTYSSSSDGYQFNGYMAEVNFVDGQQLTPSAFGSTNADTGVWQPKRYSGSYGTNGFYLNFSDNSNTTAATLGKDYSGNGNNWTPNGFLVSAGPNNDSLVDSPTSYGTDTGVGGTVRGNYCTLNPLDKGSNITLANGNLDWSGTLAGLVRGTIAAKSDKYYFECVASTSYFLGFALTSATASLSANPAAGAPSGYWGWAIDDNSNNFYFYSDGTNPFTVGRATSAGDIYQLAVDATNSASVKLWVGVNNTWYNSSGGTTGDPATGANPTVTITSGVDLFPSGCNTNSTNAVSMNFGQRPFAYTAPSGFKALCTQNLPTPTIGATSATLANLYYDASLYTGNGSNQTITNSGFQPDWIWVKARSNAQGSSLVDAVRGASKVLISNSTAAEATLTSPPTFNSNGFTSTTDISTNGYTYVAWQWKANGSGSSNTAGSITSTVSANTTAGFSIVTYTGNATSGATVGHGLGVAPSMIILKIRSTTGNWPVYHVSTGNTKALYLDLANGQGGDFTGAWNNTTPTSTVFTLGNSTETNASSGTFVAYCFAEVAGYSKIGSYTGNGSTDGPFVFTGMRPAFILIKNSSSTGYWVIFDVARNTYNAMTSQLWPNGNDAESNTYGVIDAVSNGFKLRNTAAGYNDSGSTYIYMALASNPFKYSLAR